jgi:hypothetical protein
MREQVPHLFQFSSSKFKVQSSKMLFCFTVAARLPAFAKAAVVMPVGSRRYSSLEVCDQVEL